jgi:hypothetical protein
MHRPTVATRSIRGAAALGVVALALPGPAPGPNGPHDVHLGNVVDNNAAPHA